MVWDYTEDVDHLISPYLWPMYSETFREYLRNDRYILHAAYFYN